MRFGARGSGLRGRQERGKAGTRSEVRGSRSEVRQERGKGKQVRGARSEERGKARKVAWGAEARCGLVCSEL